ncbi:MAG: protein-glutamate O-methyltransferase CheR, partial [Coriobacteriia bacterium]|nr:protein-glutamate O-methyltransferase CheR [Coriobacteriia bacterium]
TLGLHSYRQYADFLDAHDDEYQQLLDVLTINVTDFFRDPTVFELFRNEIVPSMISEKSRTRQRMIRAWSAGCSTGEETYSVAMSLLDGLKKSRPGYLLTVLGTDLDPKALEIAELAEYSVDKIQHVPKPLRLKYLEVSGDKFRVRPEVTSHVKFRRLNLFSDKPISMVDVIFCRNVFIYFSREQQETVIEMFSGALSRGGYLVLGRSERLVPSMASRFELVNGRERVYRKPRLR